jgi:hypothetical protein
LKDNRYKAVKSLIETNNIKSLKEVFEIIPLTVVRVDMGVNYNTLRRRIQSSGLLTVDDINKLSELMEVDACQLTKLAIGDLKASNSVKRKT